MATTTETRDVAAIKKFYNESGWTSTIAEFKISPRELSGIVGKKKTKKKAAKKKAAAKKVAKKTPTKKSPAKKSSKKKAAAKKSSSEVKVALRAAVAELKNQRKDLDKKIEMIEQTISSL